MLTRSLLSAQIEQGLIERNRLFEAFFAREAIGLAEACQEMARRFLRGGRLLAFGRGSYATDAQHVSVEFVHPVIVGKRALPALAVSPTQLRLLARPGDIAIGISVVVEAAEELGLLSIALGGGNTDGIVAAHVVVAESDDPLIVKEIHVTT